MKKLLLLTLLLASAGTNATTGVCMVCPTGYDCSSGTPVIGGTAGQVLVRDGTTTAWKDVATVALQGPQGARGATGPQGASASANDFPCFVYGAGNYAIENKVEGTKCYCRFKSNVKPSCVSSWVHDGFDNANGCANTCTDWRSSAVW